MSHFTVLVIGDMPEKQLAPYHEFECTGMDEFVENIDITEEVVEGFKKATIDMVRLPDGSVHEAYAHLFYRDATPDEDERIKKWDRTIAHLGKDWLDGKGYRNKIRELPQGATEFKKPEDNIVEWLDGYYGTKSVSDGELPDLEGEHKYGYAVLSASGDIIKVVKRTNQRKKWDWHVLGGRWTGFFKLKPETTGVLGRPGLFTDPAEVTRADSALKKNIDFEGMMDQSGIDAEIHYSKVLKLLGLSPHEDLPRIEHTWKSLLESVDQKKIEMEEARAKYNEQFPLTFFKEKASSKNDKDEDTKLARELCFIFNTYEDIYHCTKEEYVQRARDSAISTFAVVKDGKWYERGEMGWWGCIHDEKDQNSWNREFTTLILSVPDNTHLSVYDCHI